MIKNNDTSNVKHYKKYIDTIKIPKDQTYTIDILKDVPKYEKLNNIKINNILLHHCHWMLD